MRLLTEPMAISELQGPQGPGKGPEGEWDDSGRHCCTSRPGFSRAHFFFTPSPDKDLSGRDNRINNPSQSSTVLLNSRLDINTWHDT
ncbi:hypothetical protein EYF80_035047 [Liparis tanakae]|uniref:Uncharacterized protein n=1 Tax=Liparis tanakae TaxID=230148 RepID=A0A4Z2GPQ2_9TELE|nr:hypothetical protein EYF80_035047 [Liparis tanakae]